MEELFVKDRLRLLLDHFGDVGDPREPAKVKYPLRPAQGCPKAGAQGCEGED
ncbi:hypothetical protein [Constrictibacter sp. MBR-5]|jgi:hypothetical protein|uniref:hypothetical protein n=1 Tax=Constrictibacter sp. MBR-5 TaxID=3156467 RepID=UPI003395F260